MTFIGKKLKKKGDTTAITTHICTTSFVVSFRHVNDNALQDFWKLLFKK